MDIVVQVPSTSDTFRLYSYIIQTSMNVREVLMAVIILATTLKEAMNVHVTVGMN